MSRGLFSQPPVVQITVAWDKEQRMAGLFLHKGVWGQRHWGLPAALWISRLCLNGCASEGQTGPPCPPRSCPGPLPGRSVGGLGHTGPRCPRVSISALPLNSCCFTYLSLVFHETTYHLLGTTRSQGTEWVLYVRHGSPSQHAWGSYPHSHFAGEKSRLTGNETTSPRSRARSY